MYNNNLRNTFSFTFFSTKPLLTFFLVLVCTASLASAQLEVYNTPHFQGPVRGAPGDLLMVSGAEIQHGARAFYQYASDTSSPPAPPTTLPTSNGSFSGELDLPDLLLSTLDAYVNVPDSLTMKLPLQMEEYWPYVIYILNADGEWSDPLFINDLRPLWLSPDFAYSTAPTGSSPRTLQVVGRNLVPLHDDPLVVRLSGPDVYEIYGPNTQVTGPLDQYVIEASLPSYMIPGLYEVDVMREGVWFPVVHSVFEVLEDPKPNPFELKVSDFDCQPNDGQDDTGCVQEAIDKVFAQGGGNVLFTPGVWDLIDPFKAGQPDPLLVGIHVWRGVNLVGFSTANTFVKSHPNWGGDTVFTLDGFNEVRDLQFTGTLSGQGYLNSSFLRLGRHFLTVPEKYRADHDVEHIVIHDCKFNGMVYGIGDGGFALRRIHITDNEFQAYRDGLYLAGDPAMDSAPFKISDSVIARNLFLPGGYADESQGTIATELGASERLNFSDNDADGTVDGGWRAAFFWHQEGNNEMLLVSQNTATCTGDKAGDGEAIAFDAARNVHGFFGSQVVQAATLGTVEVNAPWLQSTKNFYGGLWAVVVKGIGVGQARKIVDYTEGSSPVLTVSPSWDVVPVAGRSEVVVTRGYWSVYTVDNEIDNRLSVGCQGTNPNGQEGLIGNLGWTFDSAFEGNLQEFSGGFHLSKHYSADPSTGANVSYGIYASEIRGNTLDSEAPSVPNGKGGIEIWHSGVKDLPGIMLTHNLAISHNHLLNADGSLGGAIATRVSSDPSSDPYALGTIQIFRNDIQGVPVGIWIDSNPGFQQTWRTVLYDNLFSNVGTPVVNGGLETVFMP